MYWFIKLFCRTTFKVVTRWFVIRNEYENWGAECTFAVKVSSVLMECLI